MKLPTTTKQSPKVTIVESTEFSQKVDRFLDSETKRGLYLLLADNPLVGQPTKELPEILRLMFAESVVLYCVNATIDEIYLLDIFRSSDTPPPSNKRDVEALRGALDRLIKLGLIASVRELLKWLRDHVGELF